MLNWIRNFRKRMNPKNQQGDSAMHDQHEMPETDTPVTSSPEAGATMSPTPPEVPTVPAAPDAPGVNDLSPAMQIRDRCIAVLKTVYDPEIPVDIYELGLIYGVDVNDESEVNLTMTLTTPMCPVAETLPVEVEDKVRNVLGVKDVNLDLVWDPPWSVDMMSDAARLELNMM